MKKYIYPILLVAVLGGTACAQQSNMNIWINSNINNTITSFPYGWWVVFDDLHDLVSELVVAGDLSPFNLEISPFGGYNFGSPGAEPFHNSSRFTFSGQSDIGMESGLALCTGRTTCFLAYPLSGYDSPGVYPGIARPAYFNSSAYNPGMTPFQIYTPPDIRLFQYTDLVALNGGDSIADANVLEFDLVPKSGNIRLQYVFSSEEYGQQPCDSFRDVMGIFLSGPGIPGDQNIALVPGTNTPVGINTIRPSGMTCDEGPGYFQYYVDNTDGENVVFDGFTTVLTASAAVNPCDTYHLRIGVADGSRHPGVCDMLNGGIENEIPHCRGLYDSGIFLKSGSLRSTDTLWVEARGGVAGDSLSPYSVRGCLPGSFRVFRGTAVPFGLSLNYTLSGSAVPGQDYSPLSGSITIPAGAAYMDIPVDALPAGNGSKTLKLILQSPYTAPCAGMLPPVLDSATLYIYDNLYAEVVQPDTTICPGCSMQILVMGDPNLQYAWAPASGLDNASIQSPVATPSQSTQYFMTASQAAPGNCPPVRDSIYVYVEGVGIGPVQDGNMQISISPNPFRESFRVDIATQDAGEQYEVVISDILGHEAWKDSGNIHQINRELKRGASSLKAGNYFLQIKCKNHHQHGLVKLVKLE